MAACQDLMGYATLPVSSWRDDELECIKDHIAQEVPVVLVYNGISHAVMMATPLNLEEFALGFTLSEGIVEMASEVRDLHLECDPKGMRIHMELSPRRIAALKVRRRALTGRTGCGLCGSESLEAAIRPVSKVIRRQLPAPAVIQHALKSMNGHQPLQRLTGSLHAAAWCDREGGISVLREDVGRHNALDKLVGAMQNRPWDESGFLLISSRASYEMVQKACSANLGTLVAVSAPTTLAIELANEAGLNLVGFARLGHHVIYTQQEPVRV